MRVFYALAGLLTLLVHAPLHAADAELVSGLADQRELAVTIYNDSLALVKDARRVKLERGTNRLAWRDVSARIRPETALLRNTGHPEGFFLIEQNFDFDLLTPQKLLDKYVGQDVRVIKTNPASGAETVETAKVLAVNNKDEAVTITVREPVPGDWEILDENQPHQKEAANAVAWKVNVPANGKATLTYRVKVRY